MPKQPTLRNFYQVADISDITPETTRVGDLIVTNTGLYRHTLTDNYALIGGDVVNITTNPNYSLIIVSKPDGSTETLQVLPPGDKTTAVYQAQHALEVTDNGLTLHSAAFEGFQTKSQTGNKYQGFIELYLTATLAVGDTYTFSDLALNDFSASASANVGFINPSGLTQLSATAQPGKLTLEDVNTVVSSTVNVSFIPVEYEGDTYDKVLMTVVIHSAQPLENTALRVRVPVMAWPVPN